ncbi:MAG: RNA polymerase sigma factor [Acidimicrobiia bacterium]
MEQAPLDRDQVAVIAGLYGPLRRFAGAVGPVEVDPDDLVQEALVRALQVRPLSEFHDVGAYLRRTIVNLATSDRRRFRRRRRALARLIGSAPAEADPVYPSDVAELLRLRPRERAVLFLHDVEGYAFREVAEMLGMRDGAVRMMASRGRRRLRELLTEEAER